MIRPAALLLLAAIVPLAPAAPEPVPGLFSTGVDGSGNPLPSGRRDPHFELVESADGGAPGPAAYVVEEGFPIPPWLANGPASKWIAPVADQGAGNAAGDYVYRTVFSLDGFIPETAVLAGSWSSDNGGVDILLNGEPTGQGQNGDFGKLHPFEISSGFAPGDNTLEFIVNNAGATVNPTGLRVEMAAVAEREPPPGTPPSIALDPEGVEVPFGGSLALRVVASGSLPLEFEWTRNGVVIEGATGSSFAVPAVTGGDAGTYRVTVRNSFGSLVSAPAIVTVTVDHPSPAEQTRERPGPSSRRTAFAITEIHYHPEDRADGRNLEFLEVMNTNPWAEPIGGFRIEGDWEFVFPADTFVPAGGHVVVAGNPADLSAVAGVQALGPADGRLSNGGGTLRLVKPSGAVLLEIDFSDSPPWPASADGAGHSLVLARPSFGEQDPRAWSASARRGGSPGTDDPVPGGPVEHLVINEVAAHTGGGDFIEIHNRSFGPAELSGCTLSDDPAVLDRFRVPPATTVPPGGFIRFSEGELGFPLDARGGVIHLTVPDGSRVVDAFRFEPTPPGAAWGRFPDGHHAASVLDVPTPGNANASPARSAVVINEILYHPLREDERSEFVELHNRSDSRVDVGGWRFTDGIDFGFPAGTSIGPRGFLVIAGDRTRLLRDHPDLDPSLVLGDFDGTLSNAGERIALARPVPNTEAGGDATLLAPVDDVTFADGGRWGRWADGGGSSLELVDPEADNRLAPNWADSDETGKAPWTTIEHTGVLDLGVNAPDQLQVFLLGAGEALVDDIEIIPAGGGTNAVPNGTFEGGAGGWFFQGTHRTSGVTTADAASGSRSLHLRAVERGDYSPNRARAPLAGSPATGSNVTIRARARWLAGHPEILLRLKGNWLEALGTLEVPAGAGTPGAPNSRRRADAPPAITEVGHDPVLPAAGEDVRVTARVADPEGLGNVTLRYRLDPDPTIQSLPMRDDGAGGDLLADDGLLTAVIPGQASGALAAFTIEATDASGNGAEFPADAPAREALVRWGDRSYDDTFGTYRIWMTRAAHDFWSSREKMSNEPVPVTFVYNDDRVVHGAGALFSGSAFTSPGYNTPTGTICGYNIVFPGDDLFLGEDEITLDFPVRDPTAQREQLMFWLLDRFGLPNNHRRYVSVFVNGIGNRSRGGWGANANAIYEDVQQPGADMVAEWFPDRDDGHLFKGDYWHEFDDAGFREAPVTGNTLQSFTTTGGVRKVARYRWNWRPRATDEASSDFAPLFELIDTLALTGDAFVPAVEARVDVSNWMRTFVVCDLASNWDSFGNPGGKNTFHYLPPGGRWSLMSWDYDVGLGVFNDPVDAPLFNLSDPMVGRVTSAPAFRREYWRRLEEAVTTFFTPGSVSPLLNAKFAAFQAAGVPLTSPNAASGAYGMSIPQWISQRRSFLLAQLATQDAPFAVTTNGGADFTTPDAVVELTGTSPVTAAGIAVNGVPHTVEWNSVTSWTLAVALEPGANTLTIAGIDEAGVPVSGLSDGITITRTGAVAPDPATGFVVINEILHSPGPGGAEFVEIHNRSASTAFDLAGWRLNGTGFTFPSGTVLGPGGFVTITDDALAFGGTHGWEIPVAGVFPGRLDDDGETLTLLAPDGAGGETLVDAVRYEARAPWPAAAATGGVSLQLVDASVDNTRPGNWEAHQPPAGGGDDDLLVPMEAAWRYNQSGSAPSTWTLPGFDDSAWPAGPALFFNESAPLPAGKNTELTLGRITYHFRTTFEFTGSPDGATLDLTPILDDGMVAWLNGTEIHRLRIDPGPVTDSTLARPPVDNAVVEGPFTVEAAGLVAGTNTLAVEVHQSVLNSSDIAFGLEVRRGGSVSLPSTPNAPNSFRRGLAPVPPLWLNELVVSNEMGPMDHAGDRDPWLELFNGGNEPILLDGWFLTDDPAVPRKWPFPAGAVVPAGGHVLVWLDGEPEESTADEWHATITPPAAPAPILVVRPDGDRDTVIDAIADITSAADTATGRFPDGSLSAPRLLRTPTPGAPNSLAVAPPPVVINEWMASNDGSILDPADGDPEDWFELFNASATEAVDLGGFTLTDDPNDPGRFTIPMGVTIAPGGFLLVWADEEPGQFTPGGDLHATFRLSADGETIALFTPEGALVDRVDFGVRSPGASGGRWPDGGIDSPEPFFDLAEATPGGANRLAPSSVPPSVPVLRLDGFTPDGDAVILELYAEPGRWFQAQTSPDLAAWSDSGEPVPGFGESLVFVLPAPSTGPFFVRVAVLP